jgi:uncharacterized protein involved in exopolysaccharide biosynthesis
MDQAVDQVTSSVVPHDEITFREYVETLRRGKWHIVAFVVLVTVIVTLAAFLLPKRYSAQVLLSAVTSAPDAGHVSGALGSMVSEMSGLSALAGLMPADQRKAEVTAVLQSDALTEKYIRDNDLLPVLFPERWDAQARRWKVDSPDKMPTLWKANQYFKKKVRTVKNDTRTGLVILTITWKDPQTAAKWGNDLVKLTNDYLRNKAIDESERDIAYLNAAVTKTDVVEVREAIYALLLSQIDKEMLARGTDEYAFKVLDPAEAPEKPSFPQPALWILAAFFGSIVLSLLAAFLHIAWSPR